MGEAGGRGAGRSWCRMAGPREPVLGVTGAPYSDPLQKSGEKFRRDSGLELEAGRSGESTEESMEW